MIFPACINLPASSHYKGMYPHGSPILWYIPNCMLTCNMRNEFAAVRVYQAVKNPATTDEFAADFNFMPE